MSASSRNDTQDMLDHLLNPPRLETMTIDLVQTLVWVTSCAHLIEVMKKLLVVLNSPIGVIIEFIDDIFTKYHTECPDVLIHVFIAVAMKNDHQSVHHTFDKYGNGFLNHPISKQRNILHCLLSPYSHIDLKLLRHILIFIENPQKLFLAKDIDGKTPLDVLFLDKYKIRENLNPEMVEQMVDMVCLLREFGFTEYVSETYDFNI